MRQFKNSNHFIQKESIMKSKLIMLTFAISCAFAGNAMALTKEEYKAQKDRVEADYKGSREKCATLSANAKDICQTEAKGAEKVAKAELEAQYKPGPRHDRNLRDVKADTAYDIAKEKCDDMSGNAKDVCIKDAKATRTAAKAEAKVSGGNADANKGQSQ
ncbi:hypothetical protein [Polaromonas sp. A23]|uniref:hypothetical protein n=1 Tax=Polaromonas sp. A23 TaxID=1944133 RepID=UPI00352B1310